MPDDHHQVILRRHEISLIPERGRQQLVQHGAEWALGAYEAICADVDRTYGIDPRSPQAADLRAVHFNADAVGGGSSTSFHAEFAMEFASLAVKAITSDTAAPHDALEELLFGVAMTVIMTRGLGARSFEAAEIASEIADATILVRFDERGLRRSTIRHSKTHVTEFENGNLSVVL